MREKPIEPGPANEGYFIIIIVLILNFFSQPRVFETNTSYMRVTEEIVDKAAADDVITMFTAESAV